MLTSIEINGTSGFLDLAGSRPHMRAYCLWANVCHPLPCSAVLLYPPIWMLPTHTSPGTHIYTQMHNSKPLVWRNWPASKGSPPPHSYSLLCGKKGCLHVLHSPPTRTLLTSLYGRGFVIGSFGGPRQARKKMM